MGLCASHPVERAYEGLVRKNLSPLSELFDLLYLKQREQRKMFSCFDRMDKDGGRSIDFEEFCWHFRIPQTRFSRRCFLLLDVSGQGEMTFPQFVICAWNYCTYDKEGLATFAFNLYDIDGEGAITNDDMFTLVEESYDIDGSARGGEFGADLVKNSPEYMIRMAKAQIMTASGHDGLMQLDEFLKFCITHPNLLKRAFSVQMKMQDEICGRSFWETLTKRRRKMTRLNNHIVDWQSIDEIIEEFAQWDATAGFMKPAAKNGRSKTLLSKKDRDKALGGKGLGGKGLGGKTKRKKQSNQSTGSPYKVAAKGGSEKSFRTLPRTKSAEDTEFDAMRARSSSMKRQKRLKRKHSAETMQKFFRKKQAQKRVAERRRLNSGKR